jgi:hypothetical protein
VASQEGTTLTVTSFTVTQAGASAPMAATLFTDTANNANGAMSGSINLAFLVANQAFLPNTVYTVTFVGTITGAAIGSASGQSFTKTWTFTTGAAGTCGPGWYC